MKTIGSGHRSRQRCSHDYDDHRRNGGDCQHTTYSEERIVHDDPADGVTLKQDWSACDCSYFSSSFMPAKVST
jgi:hypothetical protein